MERIYTENKKSLQKLKTMFDSKITVSVDIKKSLLSRPL